MAEILNIINLLIYLILLNYLRRWSAVGQVQESSEFTCESGEKINFLKVCDGILDCEDQSDEKCENDAILFYYSEDVRIEKTTHCDFRRGLRRHCYDSVFKHSSFNLAGIFLNSDKEFSVAMKNSSTLIPGYQGDDQIQQDYRDVKISSNGPQIDVFWSEDGDNFMGRMNRRNGLRADTITSINKNENGRSPVVDWVTSNVYHILNSRIEVCNQNSSICVNLQNKSITDPIFLAISSKHRLLFGIDRKSKSDFQLFRCLLDQCSEPTVVSQDLKSPQWLTIDYARDRLYWSDEREGLLEIYSSTFEGTDVKNVTNGAAQQSFVNSSFAVFDDSLYWPDSKQKNIMKSSINDFATAITFRKVFPENADSQSAIGYLTIDHRPVVSKEIKNPCDRSTCSHFCLAASETSYTCYCQGSKKPISTNTSTGYCKDETVLAAYGNSFYVIGLTENNNFKNSFIHKNTINISAISALTFNSIDGSVIFTEEEKQKIYTWIPKTGELKLILDDGVGTITSLELDDRANNLYWIDSRVDTIKVMNMHSLTMVNIFEGNSSYMPIQFTLVPLKGYMAVLFLKDSTIAVIERISMDGGPYSRKVLYQDEEIDNIENLFLHRKAQEITFLDKQTNEMKYFPSGYKDPQNFDRIPTVGGGGVKSIVTLREYTIWSESDLSILGKTSYLSGAPHDILLGSEWMKSSVETSENDYVKLASVTMQTDDERRTAKCLRNNGGCEKLCVSSSKHKKFACLCPKGETLINGTSCRKLLRVEEPIKKTNEETHPNPRNTADVKITDPHQEPEITHQITESICAESCPICEDVPSQHALSLEDKLEKSSSLAGDPVYIFHSTFIAILAATLGLVVGYLIRGRMSKHGALRLFSERGNLELSRIKPGSASTTNLIRNS